MSRIRKYGVFLKYLSLILWLCIATTCIWCFSLYPVEASHYNSEGKLVVKISIESWIIIAAYVFGGSACFQYASFLYSIKIRRIRFWMITSKYLTMILFSMMVLYSALLGAQYYSSIRLDMISVLLVIFSFLLLIIASIKLENISFNK